MVLNNFVMGPTNHSIAPSSGSLNWVAFQAFFDRSRHSFQSVLDFYRCFLRTENVTFLIQCLLRRGGLHICQQNCALIVQSDLDYWGLDDIHLQVLQLRPQKVSSNSKKTLVLSHSHATGRDSTHTNNTNASCIAIVIPEKNICTFLQPCCINKYYPHTESARHEIEEEVIMIGIILLE